jgi:integrase
MVDRERRVIVRPASKNEQERLLALEGELGAIIEGRYATRGLVSWVFHRQGQRIKTFAKAWRMACSMAKLPGRHSHDLRRNVV